MKDYVCEYIWMIESNKSLIKKKEELLKTIIELCQKRVWLYCEALITKVEFDKTKCMEAKNQDQEEKFLFGITWLQKKIKIKSSNNNLENGTTHFKGSTLYSALPQISNKSCLDSSG